jgi:hypothetical protein
MNDKIWSVTLANGTDSVTCEVCGVAQDGSLICFNVENGNPTAIRGYAPGEWKQFQRSTLRVN